MQSFLLFSDLLFGLLLHHCGHGFVVVDSLDQGVLSLISEFICELLLAMHDIQVALFLDVMLESLIHVLGEHAII